MTKTFRFMGMVLMVLMVVLVSVGFAACSNNEDEESDGGSNGKVNTSSVFTGRFPKSVAGMSLTYNSDGTLASINGNGTKVSFEYGSGTRTVADNHVKMIIDGYGYNEDAFITFIFDMELNASGFVKSCTQTWTYEGSTYTETWDFAYNRDGQLNYMKRYLPSEGGDHEITNITYQDGNIVNTKTVSEQDGAIYEHSISYSSIVNKGCIMVFDETLAIDMDEMVFAYYAGLLGKATKNLPSALMEEDDEGTIIETFTWTLNDNGLPTKMTSTNDDWDTVSFSW